jgi:hypothetical protein
MALAVTMLACGSTAVVDGTSPAPTSTTQPPPAPPGSWQTLVTSCGFSLKAPSDFVEVPVQGTDSCVVQYDSPSCVMTGDYGWYSDPLDWTASEAEYQEQTITVDSRSAKLVTFRDDQPRPLSAAIHVADTENNGSDTKLTLSARCDDAAHRDEMVTALASLDFD